MKILIITLGCRTNQAESDKIADELAAQGFTVTSNEADNKPDAGYKNPEVFRPQDSGIDLIIINTCAVTGVAERKSRHQISKISRRYPNAKIIVLGCAAENDATQFNNANVIKTFGADKSGVVQFVLGHAGESGIRWETKSGKCKNITGHTKQVFIKVQDGCDNKCSFCIINVLRGRSKSRGMRDILDEIGQILPRYASHTPEIVLTGINLSQYCDDDRGLIDLCDAVNRLCIEFGIRFRLSSLYCDILTPGFINTLSVMENFVPKFHLSLQSGSDKVLRDMNRRYTTAEFEEAVKNLRNAFSKNNECYISADVIVGFPTEGEEEFAETRRFLERLNLDHLHIFPYSPRPGTPAAEMKQILPRIVNQRAKALAAKNGGT